MWMDADDILEETEKDKFLQLKQTLSSDVDMVMMKYNTAFDEDGKPSFSYFRERWIRNCSEYRWVGAVHEVISPSGNIVYSDIAVSHAQTAHASILFSIHPSSESRNCSSTETASSYCL